MMLIRFSKESEYHFTTFSTFNNVHTLILPTVPEILIEHLNLLRKEYDLSIYGFVVMPNHMHIILRVPHEQGISKAMKSFKGSTGRRIVDCLRSGNDPYEERTSIDVRHPEKYVHHPDARTSIDVRHPEKYVHHPDARTSIDARHPEKYVHHLDARTSIDVRHPETINFDLKRITRPDGRVALWQRRFYDFNLLSEEKLIEKLEYVHNNPVKWGLVSTPADWPYSSYGSWHDLKGSLFEVDRL